MIVTGHPSNGVNGNTEGCYVFICKPLSRKTLGNLASNTQHKQNSIINWVLFNLFSYDGYEPR